MQTDKNTVSHLKSAIRAGFISMLLLALILSCPGCFLIPKEEEVLAPPLKEPVKITYDYTEIKRTTFENVVQVNGYTISVTQKDVCFESQSGRLKNIYVKSGDSIKKGQLIADFITDDLDSQIALQEIGLEMAQLDYDQAAAEKENEFSIKRAQLNVDMEELKLDTLKKKMSGMQLISPVDGIADYVINAKSGDNIDAYSTIVSVVDPGDLMVEYTGNEVSYFKLGMKVTVIIGENTYGGEVVMTPANAPRDADDQTKQSIRVKFDNIPEDVFMGEYVQINLLLDKIDNVLVIKKDLIHNAGTRKYVNLLVDGIKKECNVETGEENTTEAVIVNGLSEGDKVINN